jgi:hypothetical protein
VVELNNRCPESLQYGGEDFEAASMFLRRVAPGGGQDLQSGRVPILAGTKATAVMLTRLPKLRISVTDSQAGERLGSHLSHRIWGIPHTRMAQGVLVLPHEEGRYIHGRSRRAVRTGINKARAAGIESRPLDDLRERRAAAHCLRPGMSVLSDDVFRLPGDAWTAAFDSSGKPVAVAQMTIDRECALLQTFVSTDRASRYLLHTDIVETLVRAEVRYVAVNTTMAPLLEPSLQYWQRLLGYRIFNLALCRTPLEVAPQEPDFELEVDAERDGDRVMAAF